MSTEAAYQSTLDYLYKYVDYSLVRNLRYSPEKFDLTRMYAFVEALGEPHKAYRIIHVTGTKGKGSVSALCASALQAEGYRVGLYTSPHLSDYAERIQVNGQSISHGDLVTLVEETKPVIESIPELTTFEITTGLALLYFKQQQVQTAVLEVGLGGRLDPTNVVTPLVSVITSISYDHTAILGGTLSAIAAEKAGIIKPGVPVVVAPQREEARLVVEKIAAERNSPVIQLGRDVLLAPQEHSLESQSLLVWQASEQAYVDQYLESGGVNGWEPVRLSIPLLGYHQVENAATAYAALQAARKFGLEIGSEAIQTGFRAVSWPGRFEILHRSPTLIVDSAHNRDSAAKLRSTLDVYFPGVPVVLIFGASEDKDIHGMLSELLPGIRQVVATRSDHPRAIEPEKLVEMAHQFGRPARVSEPVGQALEEAIQLANGDAIVVGTGSIFIVANLRDAWFARSKKDVP